MWIMVNDKQRLRLPGYTGDTLQRTSVATKRLSTLSHSSSYHHIHEPHKVESDIQFHHFFHHQHSFHINALSSPPQRREGGYYYEDLLNFELHIDHLEE